MPKASEQNGLASFKGLGVIDLYLYCHCGICFLFTGAYHWHMGYIWSSKAFRDIK